MQLVKSTEQHTSLKASKAVSACLLSLGRGYPREGRAHLGQNRALWAARRQAPHARSMPLAWSCCTCPWVTCTLRAAKLEASAAKPSCRTMLKCSADAHAQSTSHNVWRNPTRLGVEEPRALRLGLRSSLCSMQLPRRSPAACPSARRHSVRVDVCMYVCMGRREGVCRSRPPHP